MAKQFDTVVTEGDVCSFCGAPAKTRSRHTGNYSCELSTNKCPAVRAKNSKGLSKAHKDGRMKTDQLDGNRGWSKGKQLTPNSEVFVECSKHSNEFVKKRLINCGILKYECAACGIKDKWMDKHIQLELDHINGNNRDNRIQNLQFLCPNCHSQTPTFKGRNINSGKTKVDDITLVKLLENGYTIRQTLLATGLAGSGGNYERVKKLINGGVA